MKRLLLLVVIAVGNNVHAMQDVKPYDPEGSFKKVIRNGIGVAATLGGAYGVFKKFKEGDVVGSLKYGAVACAGLLCFRVPDFLMNAKEKEKHLEVGRLTSRFVRAKEERHPDFEKFIKNMPVGVTMPNHTIPVEYAQVVNEKMLKIRAGYDSYMKTKTSMGYRIISAIIGFKPWHESEIDAFYKEQVRGCYSEQGSSSTFIPKEEQNNVCIPYCWAMQYGMPLWGESETCDLLICDLKNFNQGFKDGNIELIQEAPAKDGKKAKQYAKVNTTDRVMTNLLHRLATKGYDIRVNPEAISSSRATMPLFNSANEGRPISPDLEKEARRFKQILEKWYDPVKNYEGINKDFVKSFNEALGREFLNESKYNESFVYLVLEKFIQSEPYRKKVMKLIPTIESVSVLSRHNKNGVRAKPLWYEDENYNLKEKMLTLLVEAFKEDENEA